MGLYIIYFTCLFFLPSVILFFPAITKKRLQRLLAVTICLILAVATNSFAEPLKKSSFEVGTEISYIIYEEPDVMEEKGVMCGAAGSWAYHDKFMLTAEGRYSYGEVDYSSPASGDLNDIDDYILEFRGLLGYDFLASDNNTTITPYIGIGHRYLNDDFKGITTAGLYGYERESSYLYSPIGAEAITSLENGWSIGAMLEYDLFWKGKQKSHISDVFAGFDDIENDQNKGYGLRGAVKIKKECKRVDFVLEPFIRYWNIEKSEETLVAYSGVVIGYGYEPKNNSTEYGVKLTVRF